MSILSDFEDRIGGALEGVFAGMFRSPVQPVEIAKALAKAMDEGRTLGVAKVYAPLSYTVALSAADSEQFGAFTATLAGELSTYLADHAREHHYHLTGKPRIDFTVHDDLRLGRFRVSAEMASAMPGEEAVAPRPDLRDFPAPRIGTGERHATVTLTDVDHDVALRGDRVTVGRLGDCGICLNDVNASREHAAFVREGDGWAIEDLGSTNGTLLNGLPVDRQRLQDGDEIDIGVTRLTYHDMGR